MDMIRIDKEEEVFDKEVVLGRDTSSVFPSESRKVDKAILESVVGTGNRFITETELNEMKARKEGIDPSGTGLDPETGEPLKPLLQVLKENKEAKDRDWEQKIKTMKQGKNRPLDDEELEFLDSLKQEELLREREKREAEDQELRVFREARMMREMAEAKAAERAAKAAQDSLRRSAPNQGPSSTPPGGPAPSVGLSVGSKRPLSAIVKPAVVVAAKPALAVVVTAKKGKTECEEAPAAAGKSAAEGTEGEEGPGGLGLVLGYGSASESD